MKNILITLLVTFSVTTVVQAETLPESLLHCDSRFFSELYAQQGKLKNLAPMVVDNHHHAWFVPPKDNNGTVWFANPIKTGTLSIVGYSLQETDLEVMGKYYYWGLIFNDSIEAVMAALPQASWHKAGEEYFANPQIKYTGDSDWQPNTGAASGIAPAKGSVEKIALLSTSNGRTTLLCSIQGSVTNGILESLRPDLREAQK
jgi:hypothetical protein